MAMPFRNINPNSILVAMLVAVLPSAARGQDCSYYLQQAQENRRAAQENRNVGSRIGSGPMAQTYFNSAAAEESAAAQYDQKYRQCTSGGSVSPSISTGVGDGSNTTAAALQQLANVLIESRQREEANAEQEAAQREAAQRQAEARAAKQMQDAEHNADERRQAYLRQKQAEEQDVAQKLNSAIAAEIARNELNNKLDEQLGKSKTPYQFNFGKEGGSGKGEDFSNYDDPRCKVCRELGSLVPPDDGEAQLRLAIQRDKCIVDAGGCGSRVSYDQLHHDEQVLRRYLDGMDPPKICVGCSAPAR